MRLIETKFSSLIEYCKENKFEPLIIIEGHILVKDEKGEFFMCYFHKFEEILKFDKPIKVSLEYGISYLTTLIMQDY